MKIRAFRIKQFRSIIDTGWCALSADGVTVLVGQNESGKSSILDALAKTFGGALLSADDVRFNTSLPEVCVRVQPTTDEFNAALGNYADQFLPLRAHFDANHEMVEFRFFWTKDEKTPGKFRAHNEIIDSALTTSYKKIAEDIIASTAVKPAPDQMVPEASPTATPAPAPAPASAATPAPASPAAPAAETAPAAEPTVDTPPAPPSIVQFAQGLAKQAPNFVLFQEDSGLLPSRIDISDKHELVGQGVAGARNFLEAADLDLKALMESDVRGRAIMLKRANDKITRDFLDFWTQTIGKSNRLTLECEVEVYGADVPAKAGKPSLVFYISDGNEKLYPKQRSKGVSWFVSFYLQLKASEKATKNRFFLLDEPGANLHSKAQADVLRLINKIRTNIDLVYSTHSPYLIELENLHRIMAIQREKVDEDSPTTVIDAYRLGSASRDTLSAVLTAMGIDLSHQQVIKKKNNVLLEEISGFYYIHAFWKLTGAKQEVQLIPTSGVSNIPMYANCFLGWGLDFVVVVDDESHGRSVYNSLKKELFRDDERLAQKKLMKISGCPGIEDIFSPGDFKKFVLKNEKAEVKDKNSAYIKNTESSKILAALNFKLSVDRGEITSKHLSAETNAAISSLVEDITKRVRHDLSDE